MLFVLCSIFSTLFLQFLQEKAWDLQIHSYHYLKEGEYYYYQTITIM